MNYKGFYITRCPDSDIERTDKNGNVVLCDGFFYQVFTGAYMRIEIDNFCGVVGFELPDSTEENADLFAREMVDCEYKEYSPKITESVDAVVHGAEKRISRNLFKIAVELGKLSHMVAAANEVGDETLKELHAMCVDEVRHINGLIDFESAVGFQQK